MWQITVPHLQGFHTDGCHERPPKATLLDLIRLKVFSQKSTRMTLRTNWRTKGVFFLLSNETALNENLTTAQEFIVPTETLILYFLCVILNKKTEKNNQAVLFSLQKKVFDINILDSFKMKGDWRNVKIKQAYKNKKDRNDTKTQTLNLVHWLNDMTMNTILKKTTLSNSP